MMSRFIRLTDASDNQPRYTNMDLVTDMFRISGGDKTMICFGFMWGDESAFLRVLETPERILSLIEGGL